MHLILLILIIILSGCTTTNVVQNNSEIHFILGSDVMAPAGYRDLKSRTDVKVIKDYHSLETIVSQKQLTTLFKQVKRRFNFVEDKVQYGEQDYWLTMDEIPEGRFNGDCEDFAQAIRKLLLEYNIAGNLVFCKIEDGSYHIVVAVDNWILDNRREAPIKKFDIDNYRFISLMQPDGQWKMLLQGYFIN